MPTSSHSRPHSSRSGHAPNDLKKAFEQTISEKSDTVEVRNETWPLRRLRGLLWNCTDVMPEALCVELDIPHGSSYAQGVRSLTWT